jgi:hypothetical protein
MSNGKRWGIRAVASLLIFIITVIITPVALIGHWGHRTVVDSTQYLATVGPLVDDPAVQDAVSKVITDAVVKQVDTSSLVGGFLGGFIQDKTIAEKLTDPIAAGINNLVYELVHTFVASKEFAKIWYTTNEVAQASLIALLEDRPNGPIQINGDKIVLDISSMLTAVQASLVNNGFDLASKIAIPKSDAEIVLAQSAAIGQLQLVYRLSAPVLQWFPLLIAILFGLSIALARNRSRTVLAVGIALVACAGATQVLMNAAETIFVDQLAGTIFESAAASFWATFFNYLLAGLYAVLVLGIVIAFGGWYAGVSRPATSMRTAVGRGLHSMGSGVPAGVRRSFRSYAPVLRWIIAIVMVLVLSLGAFMSMDRVILLSLLTAGLLTLLEILIGPDRVDAVDEPAQLAGATS